MAVIALYTLVCLVILGMNLLRIPWTYDGFWHLKMGEDFVTKGLPFWIDHFSFTYAGERIIGAPYIFQILIYFLTTISGVEEGFLLYKMICFGLVMGLFVCMAIRFRIPLLVFFATVPILVLLLQMRQIVRPELLSYVLSVIAMFFYLKARESFNVGNMISICLLILFWVNYHTPVIGYIIFFGLFVDLAVDHFRNHNNSNRK